MAKMAGPWIPLPEEVIFLLENESATFMKAYILMLARFPVEEITDTEGIWVAGRIHAAKYRIGKTITTSMGHFNTRIWPRWIEIGLVEIKNGGIYLPMLYKKGDSILQPARIATEIKELRLWQMNMDVKSAKMEVKSAEMETTIQNLLAALEESSETAAITDKGRNVITTRPVSLRPETGLRETGNRPQRDRPISLLGLKDLKISISEANLLITGFYKSIGKSRIPKSVRDKAIASIKELGKAGYLPGEIAYALHWIPENAKEPIEHFGIVPHMIEQAVAAGRKILAAEEAKEAEKDAEAKTHTDRASEEDERDRLKRYKEALTPKEQTQLREDAMQKLREMPGIKSDYIVDALVEVMENDLIRKSGVDIRQEGLESADNVSEE